jgi:rod shape-determining protein MreC
VNKRGETILGLALPLKTVLQRFAYAGLLVMAGGLMLLGKIDTVVVEEVRIRVSDAISPVLETLSRPLGFVADFAGNIHGIARLKEENTRLHEENARLMQWQIIARRLDGENRSLRELLNFDLGPAVTFVAARSIADTSGPFARSALINVGARDGINPRQAVITGKGLVGRVLRVGSRSARVLLVTDLNSKIPVVVGEAREWAMLAGDNSDQPQLQYLSPDAKAGRGDLVLTSGHGGLFPPGLPIGLVAGNIDGDVTVQPFVDWHRLEFLRVVDYTPPAAPDRLREE